MLPSFPPAFLQREKGQNVPTAKMVLREIRAPLTEYFAETNSILCTVRGSVVMSIARFI